MMLLVHMLVAGTLLTGSAPAGAAPGEVAGAPAPRPTVVAVRPQPDSAEMLLKQGNDALARGDNKRASELFQRLAERYPRTTYGKDARYFQALALYRTGEIARLREARGVLDGLREVDNRSLRSDALALDTRICGELARRGDERCARTVTTRAEGALDVGGMVNDIVRATTAATADALSSPEVQSAIESAGAAARAGVDESMRAAGEAMRGVAEGLRGTSVGGAYGAGYGSAVAGSIGGGVGRGRARAQTECEKDDDNDVAVIALNAVNQMDAQQAVPLLRKVMARRDKCSEVLRRTAVMLIAQKKAPDAADMLIDAARNDPDADVRQQAVFWLSRVSSERAAQFLREVALKPGDSEVRKQALYALSRSSAPGARETLRQVAASNDPDLEVRSQAIFWLGQQGSPEDLDYLRALYPKLGSQRLKEQLVSTLARRKGSSEWLLGIALDPKESTENRTQALFWAGQSGAPTEQLVGLYDKTSDKQMKEQLINVYRQRGSGPAFDKLLDIAKTEKDADLRRNAFYWLSRSKDPRALKYIEDLLAGKP